MGGHVIYPGRAVCAHLQCGVPGGIVFTSVYFVTAIGMTGGNLAILWAVVQRVAQWQALGLDWVIGGDWNCDFEAVNVKGWVEKLAGLAFVPSEATCIMDAGSSKIDVFLAASNLVPGLDKQAKVLNAQATIPPPHFPVHLVVYGSGRPMWCRVADEPKKFPPIPPVGCARYPYRWDGLRCIFDSVQSASDLPRVWDAVLDGMDFELAGRFDKIDLGAKAFVGRSGPPRFKWEQMAWTPPRKREYRYAKVAAWATAKRWVAHLRSEKDKLHRSCERLRICSTVRKLTEMQYLKVLQSFDEAGRHCDKISAEQGVLKELGEEFSEFLQKGLVMMVDPIFESITDAIATKADKVIGQERSRTEKIWRELARESFLGGASRAHAMSKVRAQAEVLQYSQESQPYSWQIRPCSTALRCGRITSFKRLPYLLMLVSVKAFPTSRRLMFEVL